jgi:hypothetical protein
MVTTSAAHGLAAGDLAFIDQSNDPALVTNSGDEGVCTWCGRNNGTRSMGEMKTVVSVSGLNVTFTTPLYYNYEATFQPAIICQATNAGKILNAGIEKLWLNAANGQTSGCLVEFARTEYCWIKNVEMSNCPLDNIRLRHFSRGSEVRECYIHDTAAGYSTGGSGYGVALYAWSTDNLVEDNIFVYIGHPVLIGSQGGTANVVAYNYMVIDRRDDNGEWWTKDSGTHGAHTYMNLWEGNVMNKFGGDDTWGSGSHNIAFRNLIKGQTTLTQYRHVIEVNAHNYYWSFVGNILGYPGIVAAGWVETENPVLSINDKYFWRVGYSGTRAGYPTDGNSAATLLKHGNYDYFNLATVWDPSISDHVIPDSLYLSSKPAWFAVLPWPPFTPERQDFNPSNLNKIPAQARYENGPGIGLPYNPAQGY